MKPIHIFLLTIAVVISLAGCASTEEFKTTATKTVFNYDMNYATVYRQLLKVERQCEGPNRITGDIFPDIKEATITRDQMMGMGMWGHMTFYSVEIKETAPNKTQMTVYTSAGGSKFVPERVNGAAAKGTVYCL